MLKTFTDLHNYTRETERWFLPGAGNSGYNCSKAIIREVFTSLLERMVELELRIKELEGKND